MYMRLQNTEHYNDRRNSHVRALINFKKCPFIALVFCRHNLKSIAGSAEKRWLPHGIAWYRARTPCRTRREACKPASCVGSQLEQQAAQPACRPLRDSRSFLEGLSHMQTPLVVHLIPAVGVDTAENGRGQA